MFGSSKGLWAAPNSNFEGPSIFLKDIMLSPRQWLKYLAWGNDKGLSHLDWTVPPPVQPPRLPHPAGLAAPGAVQVWDAWPTLLSWKPNWSWEFWCPLCRNQCKEGSEFCTGLVFTPSCFVWWHNGASAVQSCDRSLRRLLSGWQLSAGFCDCIVRRLIQAPWEGGLERLPLSCRHENHLQQETLVQSYEIPNMPAGRSFVGDRRVAQSRTF